jgi:hypothetical protein
MSKLGLSAGMILLLLFTAGPLIAQNNFTKVMKKSETIIINAGIDATPGNIVIKLMNDNAILIADKKSAVVVVSTLNGKIKKTYNLGGSPFRITDATLDEKGVLYILDGMKGFVFKLNEKGKIEKQIKVVYGDEISIENGCLFLYRKGFSKIYKNESIIYKYDLMGKLLAHFGTPQKSADKEALMLIGGSMSFKDSNIVVNHCTNYSVLFYNKDGRLIKTYAKKPSFYSDFKKFKDPNKTKEQESEWLKYTHHLFSIPYGKDTVISYYCNGSMTGAWLFVQNGTKKAEYKIPEYLMPVFIRGKILFFLNTKACTDKTVILDSYELGADII